MINTEKHELLHLDPAKLQELIHEICSQGMEQLYQSIFYLR